MGGCRVCLRVCDPKAELAEVAEVAEVARHALWPRTHGRLP